MKNKNGFTLTEVIVVLVILAVIIALSVPTVLKYIDEAEGAKYLTTARAINTEVSLYVEKEFIKDGYTPETISRLRKELSYGSQSKLESIVETPEADRYNLFSVDLSFDGLYDDSGWDYNKSKTKHSISKISLCFTRENSINEKSKFVVTLNNKKAYYYKNGDEAIKKIGKEEGPIFSR